jgi:protoporphyrinogen oxidase
LGAGISGIFLGLKLKQKNKKDFLILEKESRPGGLCRSFRMGKLYYDIGAHALHKEAIESSGELFQIINTDNLYCQKRKAKVFIFGRLIPHPFQLHLFYAPILVKIKCFISFLIRPKSNNRSNLFDWLQEKFGKQVCKYFLFPYNEKAWQTDLKNISINWVSRVSFGRLRFLKGLIFRGDQNYNSNEYVCYANIGGFENIFLKSTDKINNNIKVNCEVVKIDLDNKIVEDNEGNFYRYNNLITSLPVDMFVKKLLVNKNKTIINLVEQLEKVSTCLVTVLTNKNSSSLQRIYIPDKKYLAQRIIINSNSSQSLKNENESIFSLEISYKNKKDLPDKNIILNNCKGLLKDLEMIKNDNDILDYKIEFFEYMYPTQTVKLKQTLFKVKKYLKNYNCYTIGRFGSWNYANVDGILNEVNDLINNEIKK